MAFLFRRKLVCFYCGCKSAQTRTPNVRRWQCAHCEAENYLDEDGGITDPPADDISSGARFPQSLARPTSPAFVTPDESLFCPTCVKNQHLVSQALASYLPPPDAPDYGEYLKAEDDYLKGLEDRYPQVCKRCEPRVQEKIRAAGYVAKTDHLRRMMDRTRGKDIQYRDASWRGPLIALGGVGWFLSLAGQILWDGLSLFDFTEDRHIPRDASTCLQQLMRGSGSISDCTELLYSAVGLALCVGVLSSWWNPVLQETLRRKGGRAIGTADFYQLQGLLLIVRCVTWWYLPRSALTMQTTKATHLSLLVIAATITVASFRSIRMDYSNPVRFQDSPGPLVSHVTQQEASGMGTGGFGYIPQRSRSTSTRNDGSIRPFSITDFAPPGTQHPPIYQSPTPPPDDDDDQAMDWTPSQENKILRPAAPYRRFNATSHQPAPISYRDTLPADTLSQSRSLRNGPNQPVFRTGFSKRNQESFVTPKKYSVRDSNNESPFATPYEPSLAASSPELSPIKFAQPKFFPHTDREDLGLESLMANNFSLAEEPPEILARQQHGKRQNESRSRMDNVYEQWNGPAALLLLAISCIVWTSTPIPSLAAFRMHLRLGALCIVALVILKSLMPAVRKNSDRSLSDIVLLVFELTTTMILGLALRQRAAISPSKTTVGPLETPGTFLIALLIVQEAWMLCSGTYVRRRNNGKVPTLPVPQPAVASDHQQPSAESSVSSSEHNSSVGTGIDVKDQYLPAASQRTTRFRTKVQNDVRAPGGFSSLSIGDNTGMNSLKLGQPQRRNRNGMW